MWVNSRALSGGHAREQESPPGGRMGAAMPRAVPGLLLEEAQKLIAVMRDTNTEAARERRIRVALDAIGALGADRRS